MRGIVIPARGGSKGLPLKNLRTVGGKPLVTRCVETVRQTGYRVIVSTDHEEIAKEARAAGAEVLPRPMELATDTTETWEVIRHAVASCKLASVAYVQCTAPFVTAEDVHGCFHKIDNGYDLGLCVHASHAFLINGRGEAINFKYPIPRRQDFEPQFAISGSVWAAGYKYIRDKPLYHGRIGLVHSSFPLRLDIDTEADLYIANAVLRGL